jgi:hypothetical protein
VELTEDKSAMLGGSPGPARRWAIEQQLKLGRYTRLLGAENAPAMF